MSDGAKVYVVMGTVGEYSDRQQWAVAAFLEEDRAIAALRELEAWCREHGCHASQHSRISSDAAQRALLQRWSAHEEAVREAADWDDDKVNYGNPLDPAMKWSYTGVDYWVMPTELR